MATKRTARHQWLRVLSWGCAAASVIIIVIGGLLIATAPDGIKEQHFWSAVKDIGPAIAGSWVLCAALLAITAAGVTAISSATDADNRDAARLEAIKRVCIAEIQTFFDRCNELKLHATLTDHLKWLRKQFENPGAKADAFRRDFGDDWFIFFRVDPEALGMLDPRTSAKYISLSAHARHLTSRLNWLNSCTYDEKRGQFWINYHSHTLTVLDDLYPLAEEVLRLLGDNDTDPRNFRF